MSIVKMKKLRLLCLADQRDELMKALQFAGCVQIDDAAGELGDTSSLRRCGSSAAEYRTRAAQLSFALGALDDISPHKTGLLTPNPDVTEKRLFDDALLSGALETAAGISGLSAKVSSAKAEISRINADIAALTPWVSLGFPLELTSTEKADVFLGTLPAAAPFAEVEAAVCGENELCFMRLSDADKDAQYVAVISHKAETEAVLTALRGFGFSRTVFPERTGMPEDNIAKLRETGDDLSKSIAEAEAAIAVLDGERENLTLALDRTNQDIERAEAEERLFASPRIFAMTGWFPAAEESRLTEVLSKYDCAWEAMEPEEEQYPEVPVKLKNGRLTRCLNMVTDMYSLPAYDGVDPNPLMAPFFILFYGIMMADMGYGLLMALVGFIALKKKKPQGGTRNFCELMLYCGISTFAWGAITGGFFGDAPVQLVKMFNPASTWQGLPALFSPLDDTIMILIGSMALGLVQIIAGMAVSFVEKIKAREYMDALFEEVTWWVVFAGIGCMALGVTNIVIYAGVALVVLGPLVQGKGFGKVTGIFGSLYNHVTGFFGDILSYSRLMALMLAGSVIAQVFNTLGTSTGSIFLFIPIFLAGHALNFGLNLLGCYVHDMRLQCLEYFGKFYKDGGQPFKPLNVNPKHYVVNN